MKLSKDFLRIQRALQRALPSLGLLIIVGVYVITAIVMGYFLHTRLIAESHAGTLAAIIAYGTGFGSQLTRGYIVFNGQLTPHYMKFGIDRSILFAFILAAYTGYEAFHLSPTLFISVLGLIGSGFVVEFLYLQALNRASRMQLIGDKASLNRLREYFQAENQLERFLDSLDDEEDEDPLSLSGVKSGNGVY